MRRSSSSCAKAGPGLYADRTRGLIAILWRAGLRISEVLALTESDLDPKTGSVLVFARGFLFELVELGYACTARTARLRLMAELSSWIAARAIEPKELTPSLMSEFLEPLRAQGPRKEWCSLTSERQLLAYLRGLGSVAEPEVRVLSDPLDVLVAEFVEYLVRERGLMVGSTSVYEYERVARLFLSGRIDPDGGGLDRLTAGDVTRFVLAECRRRRVRMSWTLVSWLRGVLRFLFLEGLTTCDLTGAVPGVAKWRAASLPKALRAEDVARLLASCDRPTAVGRRDFAILTMLSRLGLRACEVTRLELASTPRPSVPSSCRSSSSPAVHDSIPAPPGSTVHSGGSWLPSTPRLLTGPGSE